MRKYFRLAVVLICGVVFAGCSDHGKKVGTSKELIESIRPNATIYLKPGKYLLSDEAGLTTEWVKWLDVFDGQTIEIKNVSNLKIYGEPGKESETRVLVTPRYAHVLAFTKSKNITLKNLTMGHFPEEGYCYGGVVYAGSVDGINIENCDLFGCGTEGLSLYDVENVSFKSSIIRDCSYGIMTVQDSKNINFEDSKFLRNREYHGVALSICSNIKFNNCLFKENFKGNLEFMPCKVINEKDCNKVSIKNCTFENNKNFTGNFNREEE